MAKQQLPTSAASKSLRKLAATLSSKVRAGKAVLSTAARAPTCGSRSSRVTLIILAVLTFTLSAAAVYFLLGRPVPGAWIAEKFSGAGQAPKGVQRVRARLVFLSLDGCGWCERFKPTWAELERKDGAALQQQGVMLEHHEASEPGAAPYTAYAKGYPTVLFVWEDGKAVRFEHDRTRDALLEFVQVQLRSGDAGAAEEAFETERVTTGAHDLLSSAATAVQSNSTQDDEVKMLRENAGVKLPNPYA